MEYTLWVWRFFHGQYNSSLMYVQTRDLFTLLYCRALQVLFRATSGFLVILKTELKVLTNENQ
jgi:hypothetical protein